MSLPDPDTFSIPRAFLRDGHFHGLSLTAGAAALAFFYLDSTPQHEFDYELLEHLTDFSPANLESAVAELECLNIISTESGGLFSRRRFTLNPVTDWIVQDDNCCCIGN